MRKLLFTLLMCITSFAAMADDRSLDEIRQVLEESSTRQVQEKVFMSSTFNRILTQIPSISAQTVTIIHATFRKHVIGFGNANTKSTPFVILSV